VEHTEVDEAVGLGDLPEKTLDSRLSMEWQTLALPARQIKRGLRLARDGETMCFNP
jgi:hypothetical protein